MRLSHYVDLLSRYHNFEDCMILDYWSENYCRDFVVLVSNIWEDSGQMRPMSSFCSPVLFRFIQCQSIRINNALWDAVVVHPEEVNWGINEFSLMEVTELRMPLPGQWFQFAFRWERDRHIEIDCQGMEFETLQVTEELNKKYPWTAC